MTDQLNLTLVTGGARSGKSTFAEQLALEMGGDQVTYIATLTAGDQEMQDRIKTHRLRRPKLWQTLEPPTTPIQAIPMVTGDVILLDCLSGWISTLLLENENLPAPDFDTLVDRSIEKLVAAIAGSNRRVIVVTNEVGSGVVPATQMGRIFRDALGRANLSIAGAADEVIEIVVGIPRQLK